MIVSLFGWEHSRVNGGRLEASVAWATAYKRQAWGEWGACRARGCSPITTYLGT